MDIIGRAGLFLEGMVSPELQGVEISITERGAAAPLITVATNEMGAYRYENPDWKIGSTLVTWRIFETEQ